MSTHNGMSYRAISQEQANWIGNAASAAGGYVAVDGPRIARMPASHYSDLTDEIERCYNAGLDAEYRSGREAERAKYRHKLQGGDHAAVSERGDYVLRVPEGGPLHDMGYPIPASLINELIPLLRDSGYDA